MELAPELDTTLAGFSPDLTSGLRQSHENPPF